MDHTTRNDTIRALAAASAAEIRSRSERALRAHALRPVSGEIVRPELRRLTEITCAARGIGRCRACAEMPPRRTTDRPLPLDHEPHRWLSAPVPARDLAPDLMILRGMR